MIYLCRFRQRTRLIEIPISSEYYHQQNGISHEHLRHLISKYFSFRNSNSFGILVEEFQLQQFVQSRLIIQLWNEQYQEYIDMESYKRIPSEGRLQVLM